MNKIFQNNSFSEKGKRHVQHEIEEVWVRFAHERKSENWNIFHPSPRDLHFPSTENCVFLLSLIFLSNETFSLEFSGKFSTHYSQKYF